LLEALVALAIVSMVVLSFLGIRTTALVDATRARNWRLAREIAEEKLSEVQAGALENPVQSGEERKLEKYPGFSYRVVVGENAVTRLESDLASEAAGTDETANDRLAWQRNREEYRRASARGLSAVEYHDKLVEEEDQRRLESKAPSETDLEQVAVVVYFPKLDAEQEGQRDALLIKSRLSTLALSGMTPDEAAVVAAAKGGSSATPGGASPGSGASGAGSGSGATGGAKGPK
jgi:Tfp pilus assembly protein PilV